MPDVEDTVEELPSLGRTVLLPSDGRLGKVKEITSLVVAVMISEFPVDKSTELEELTSAEELEPDKSVAEVVVAPTVDDVEVLPCVEDELAEN